jgi:hypothetical protein
MTPPISLFLAVAPAAGAAPEAADPADRPNLVRLVGGIGMGAGSGSVGGHALGRVLLQGRRFSADVAAREGWYGGPSRSLGGLFFGARWTPPGPAYVRGGFAHHHEVPEAQFLASPATAILGTSEGIDHRSGVELGAGLWAPVPVDLDILERFGWGLDLSGGWLPGSEPVAYGYLDLNVTIDVGPR